MRKLLTSILFLPLLGLSFAEDNIPYISPGLRVGCDFSPLIVKFLQKCNEYFEFSTVKSMFQLYIKYQIFSDTPVTQTIFGG
jgi:hypothetical protein